MLQNVPSGDAIFMKVHIHATRKQTFAHGQIHWPFDKGIKLASHGKCHGYRSVGGYCFLATEARSCI